MADWNVPLAYLIVTGFGIVVGFALTSVSGWRENRRKVGDLRRFLYNDIFLIHFNFKTLREIFVETLADKEYGTLLNDEENVNAMLDFCDKLREDALRDDWYKNARADPHVFAQLSDNELRVIEGIHVILSKEAATSKADVYRARLRRQVGKPKDRFNLEKANVERTLNTLENLIRGGLKKSEFLRATASDEIRADSALMFGDDPTR
jgi:hypothetical protein